MEINKSLIITETDTLNEMRDKIYQNACDHGWHDEERSIQEYCALFHSEVSEMLEEFRMQAPKELYFNDDDLYPNFFINDVYENAHDASYNSFEHISGLKPHGYGIELADLVIRLLDFCGAMKIDFECSKVISDGTDLNSDTGLHSFICALHGCINNFMQLVCSPISVKENWHDCIINLLDACYAFANFKKTDLNKMITIKHKYNLTRPYKHGKRF
jgi:hypothetical protein